MTPEQMARLRELAEALGTERENYRALVMQHAQATEQKVGYVTRPVALSVALDRYRAATEPDSILALLSAITTLQQEKAALVKERDMWLNACHPGGGHHPDMTWQILYEQAEATTRRLELTLQQIANLAPVDAFAAGIAIEKARHALKEKPDATPR